MNNWKDYIASKFVPANQFTFETDADESYITVKHLMTGTKFNFFGLSYDLQELSDVQFYNEKTRGWSGEFRDPIIFSEEQVKYVDHFLEPAFETGWMSADTYLFNRHWKSTVYFNLEKKGPTFFYFSSELGCLSGLLYPVFLPLSFVMGSTYVVKIDPVIKYLPT